MNEGIVYVLTNPAMPKLVKIGKTGRGVETRLNDLYTTGVPLPFEYAYAARVEDMDKVGLENPEMVSLLIHQLQTIAAKGLEMNQLGSAVAATKELAALLGIGMHNRSQRGWHGTRRA